jgi:hypothetical protein
MNNKHSTRIMKTIATHRLLNLTCIVIGLLTTAPATLQAAPDDSARGKIAVTAHSDFAIVPPNLGPYLIQGNDGDLYLRHLPLVGKFTLSGKGVALEAKVHVDLSGEFDATGTGPVWFPVTVTATIDGVKTILFEGRGSAYEVHLVAVGEVSLTGRGPYKGTKLELTFEEIGPGDSNTFNYRGYLIPVPTK